MNAPHNRDMFVIMPFSATDSCSGEQWTEIFEDLFCPAATEAGLDCDRAQVSTGSLIKSIVERLRNAYVVLADITDANPNVFYELGVRHSLAKRTIIASQHTNQIPSDLLGYWSLTYGTSPKQVKQFKYELKRILGQIESEPEKCDSPVSDYLELEQISISRNVQRENVRKLGALFTELTGNLVSLSELTDNEGSFSLVSVGCMSLLLDTRYIDPGSDVLKRIYELRKYLHLISAGQRGEIVSAAISISSQVMQEVESIQRRLESGSYSEPINTTNMIWVPSFGVSNDVPISINNLRNSTCKEITDEDWADESHLKSTPSVVERPSEQS